jgi:hypothetical protein
MTEHGSLHVDQAIPEIGPDKFQSSQTAEQDEHRLHLGAASELALA